MAKDMYSTDTNFHYLIVCIYICNIIIYIPYYFVYM